MKSKGKEILFVAVVSVIGLHFTMVGLVAAMGFLAPLSIAVILTMVLVPLSRMLEGWGMGRALSSLVGVLLTMIVFVSLFAGISVQANNVLEDWPRIEKNLQPTISAVTDFVEENTGLTATEQKETIEKTVSENGNDQSNGESSNGESSNSESSNSERSNGESSNGESGERNNDKSQKKSASKSTSDSPGLSNYVGFLGTAIMGFMGFLGSSLLVFIYIFFMLLYRRKLKLSVLKFFSAENRENAQQVLNDSIKLSQNYLVGRLLLMLFLTILYTVGLTISGVENALLVSVLAAVLSLLPYIGVVIGYVLAMAMAAFTGGAIGTFIGVTITYSIAQFIESYILEPYVVGEKVNLNPLVTILIVVLGGAVWGIMGMIISIPVFGILKIIFDRIPALRPMGYMLGEEDVGSDEKEEGMFDKWGKRIKAWFSDLRS